MSSRSIRTVLVLLVALGSTAACSDADRPAGSDPVGIETSLASAQAVGHARGVEALIAAHSAAWADKDAVAYGATYTADAQVINPVGGILAGRAVITAQHAFLFNPATGPFRESVSSWTLRSLDFLSGHQALVGFDVALTNISVVLPGLPPAEPGVVRTRVTWVAVLERGEWKIMHQQMTPIPPA